MSLVNTETGEVVAALSETDARELIDSLKRAVTIAENQIIRAWEGRAWLALGYASWDEMVAVEFKTHYLKIAPDERRQAAIEMAKVGMSTRAIGSALGVGKSTIDRDLNTGVPDGTPGRTVIGTDGKTYPATQPERVDGTADADGAGGPTPAPAPLLTEPEWNEAEEEAELNQPRMPVEPAPKPTAEEIALAGVLDEVAAENMTLQVQEDINRACLGLYRSLLNRFDPQFIAVHLDDNTVEAVASLESELHRWLLTARNSRPRPFQLIKGNKS